MKVGEDDGTGSLGMPVIAEDLQTILGFYGIFVVAGCDPVWTVLEISDNLVLLDD